MDLLEALLLAACFAVIEIPVSSFQIPHFEVAIESLIHVLIRNDPRKENRKFYLLLYSEISFDFPSSTSRNRSRDMRFIFTHLFVIFKIDAMVLDCCFLFACTTSGAFNFLSFPLGCH